MAVLPLGLFVFFRAAGLFVLFLALAVSASGLVLFSLHPLILRRLGFLALLAGFGAASGGLASFRLISEIPYAGLPVAQVTEVTGTLIDDGVRLSSGGYRYRMRLSSVAGTMGSSALGRGLVFCFTDEALPGGWGYRLTCRAALSQAKDELGFSIFAEAERGGLSSIEPGSAVYRFRYELRRAVRFRFHSMGGEASRLIIALVLGERDDPNDRDLLLFKSSGTAHILALSGLHLGILSGLLVLLLAPLFGKRTARVISLFLMALYTFIAGPFPSLLRAFVMSFCVGFLSLFKREASGLHALGVSFIILVSARPDFLWQLSTQLSFLALFGVFVLAPLTEVLTRQIFPRSLGSALGSSIGAFLFTLPVIASSFGVVYPVGIVAGLALVPLVTVFIWAGLAFLPFCSIPVLSSLISACMDGLHAALLRVAGFFSSVPPLALTVPRVLVLTGSFIVLYGAMWIGMRRVLFRRAV